MSKHSITLTNLVGKLFDDKFSCQIQKEIQYENVILDRFD